MSLLKRLIGGWVLVVGLTTAVAAAPIAQEASSGRGATVVKPLREAQARAKTPSPTPAVERGPSNVDLVNKALKPGASNPDVPMPHPDLASPATNQSELTGIYGRQEQGGGVFGFRVPIPATRNGSTGTRSSSP